MFLHFNLKEYLMLSEFKMQSKLMIPYGISIVHLQCVYFWSYCRINIHIAVHFLLREYTCQNSFLRVMKSGMSLGDTGQVHFIGNGLRASKSFIYPNWCHLSDCLRLLNKHSHKSNLKPWPCVWKPQEMTCQLILWCLPL